MIRRASLSDAAAIAEVFLAARREMLAIVPMVHPDNSALPWIRDSLFRETKLFVAEHRLAVVAMMSLSPGWIEHLYVHPGAQNAHLGTKLLALAKTSWQARNGLELWTFQANRGARRFYERHGFEPAEFTDGSGNEEKTPDVRYVWRPPR